MSLFAVGIHLSAVGKRRSCVLTTIGWLKAIEKDCVPSILAKSVANSLNIGSTINPTAGSR